MRAEVLREMSSSGPFSDSQKILRDANSWYRHTLTWLEVDLGVADREDALWRKLNTLSPASRSFVFRSGPVRALIDNLASELFRQPASASHPDVLDAYEKLRRSLKGVPELEHDEQSADYRPLWREAGYDVETVLAEPFPYLLSGWSGTKNGTHPENTSNWSESLEVQRLFEAHMADSVGTEECVLRPLSVDRAQQIETALECLQRICVHVVHDVVVNVRHICMIDFARWQSMADSDYREIGQSVSSHIVPSCCFFSLHSFSTMPLLIEAIYHEALHKKLSNLIYAKKILRDYYDALSAPRFHSYWNLSTRWNSNQWEFDRAMYAFHLYAHLVVLYGTVLEMEGEQEELPRAWCVDRRKVSLERAKAIGAWLYQHADGCMGPDGLPFISTMMRYVTAAS